LILQKKDDMPDNWWDYGINPNPFGLDPDGPLGCETDW